MDAGDRIASYELERLVGRGAWSSVWRAWDRELGRHVAIKELLPDAPPVVVETWRFAASLSHPHVVGVLELLAHERSELLVMELMEGGSLRPWVGRMSLPQVARVMEDALAGLEYLAGQGLVHRDVKPENLLLHEDGRLKIGDLGLVARAGSVPPEWTTAGTPEYMAPEQAMAQEIRPAADLYALGCVAFELLSGRLPFSREGGPLATMLRQVNEPAPRLTGAAPEVADWVDGLLAKDPARRPSSATAAWDALEAIVIGLHGQRWRRETATGRPPDEPAPHAPPAGGAWEAPPEPYSPPTGASLPPPAPAAEAPFDTLAPAPAMPPAKVGYDTWPPPAPPAAVPESFDTFAPLPSAPPPLPPPPAPLPPSAPPMFEPPPGVPVPEIVVRRTPHLDLPAEVTPGQLFDAVVYLDLAAARGHEQVEDVVVRVPASIQEISLDAWLVATRHFVVVDAPVKRLALRVDEARSEQVAFRIAVQSAPAPGEEAVISAAFSHNGRPGGRVSGTVAFAGQARPEPPAAAPEPVLEIDATAAPPDLTVEIIAVENDGRRFEVRVATPLLQLDRSTEAWWLPAHSQALVEATMQRFFAPDAGRAARLASLRGAGIEFYDAAPALFKAAFWQLHDVGRAPRTLFIVSDEASIPWELMIPHRRTANGVETREPLGVELAVGRWHRGTGISPRQRIPLRTSLVVAPRYRGSRVLATAEEEAEYVCARFAGRRVDPARFEHLEAVFAEGGADLLHFICHGEADRGGVQVLLLEDPDALDAQQVRAMAGLSAACRSRKPLVFLNACEVGRPAPGLVGPAGFARAFIDIEASGVIGTLWSVDDRTAHDVASRFYAGLSEDVPFAEILRRIRADGFRPGGEDSYAAYCFYGDPAARADGPMPRRP